MTRHFRTFSRPAFTLVELIFVIMVLGIVASIGSDIIVNTYSAYVDERAVHRAAIKTELAALQITNRLAHAIPGTVIARKDAATISALEEVPDTSYPILQWIGSDLDGQNYTRSNDFRPAWSGFCDVNQSSTNIIVTHGSRVDKIGGIISNTSGGADGIADAALFFAGSTTYDTNNIGYLGGTGGNTGANPIRGVTAGPQPAINLTPVAAGSRHISELYKLAWSSYAIVPTNETVAADGTKEWDLELHYGFQPWQGEAYNGASAKISTLIRGVSVFKFQSIGNTIRFKICQRERLSNGDYTPICKEKAVIR